MGKDNFDEEEMMREMSEALGKQIDAELDGKTDEEQSLDDKSNDNYIEDDYIEDKEYGEEDYLNEDIEEGKRKFPKKVIYGILGGSALLICIVLCVGFFFVKGMLNKMNYVPDDSVIMEETDLTEEEYQEFLNEKLNATPRPFTDAEDAVINILLIGEEAMKDVNYGRSDAMMIASVNLKEKSYKITSIMRDIYVKIPGYKDNKLNAAYNKGGGKLLTETIEANFHIKIDGYVKVGFDSFETIVDQLGGVEINLTETEAKYLNTTNYISKKKYRTVKPGLQVLNGNQALGYCRVRYRTASNGEANDFGRTYRQRVVLNSIFKKFIQVDVAKKIEVASSLLSQVYTNIDTNTMMGYITEAAMLGTTDLQTFRIPVDGAYKGDKLYCGGSTLRSSVLVLDFDKNIGELRKFIYAEPFEGSTIDNYYIGNNTSDNSGSSNSSGNSNSNANNTNQGTASTAAPTAKPVITASPAPTQTPSIMATQPPTVDSDNPSQLLPPQTEVPGDYEDPEDTDDMESEEGSTMDPSQGVESTEDPVEQPTDTPIDVQPTQQPTDSTDLPIKTQEPVTPTQAPVTPTQETTAPTQAPVTPTQVPVVQTEAPVSPEEQSENSIDDMDDQDYVQNEGE